MLEVSNSDGTVDRYYYDTSKSVRGFYMAEFGIRKKRVAKSNN